MFDPKLLVGSALLAALLSGCGGSSSSSDDAGAPPSGGDDGVAFSFVESTIADLHTSLETGGITCEEVVQGYIDRIEAYDDIGSATELNSVVAINPEAIIDAREKDLNFAVTGIDGPLYCVPVLPKDNFNTAQMPTSGGALAFQYNQPTRDAYTVRRMRDAGAIVLGKANMDEFAFGFRGESSVRGLVKNAYDLTKGSGGSSTGTAIGASLALLGTGSDTGGSVRVPSSLNGLVGIRPSLRLVSLDGIMPLATWQDTGGPMCRTVEDCALLMDAMVGFDTSAASNQRVSFEIDARLINNEVEYQQVTGVPETYTEFLDANGLDGARIGVVRDLFGSNDSVLAVMDQAIANMEAAGAVVEDVTIDDLGAILGDYQSMSSYEFRHDLEAYLNAWPNTMDGHILDYDDLVASGGYLDRNQGSLEFRGGIDLNNLTDEQRVVYEKNTIERPVFVRERLMRALDNLDVDGNPVGTPYDVLLYPAITGLAGNLGGNPSTGSNNRLSPFSLFPALVMPAGMAEDLEPAMPVGMEMLGREFDEETLIKLAYAYQEQFQPRVAPTFTPEL
jgi:amidase